MANIKVTPKTKSMTPVPLVEARMINVSPMKLDVIHMLLAEIGKETDIDENLEYTLSADTYVKARQLKGEKARDHTYSKLKKLVWGEPKKHDYGISGTFFEMYNADKSHGIRINFVQRVEYLDGQATIKIKISEDFKKLLVQAKKEKGRKVFAALQYVLPMQSSYSKRLYLMCKEFETTGVRYTESHNFDEFRERMGVPKSYSDNMVKKKVLEVSKKEINELSDIEIDYELETVKGRGRSGQKITGVTFKIKKKESNQLPGQMDIFDYPEYLPEEDLNISIKKSLQLAIPELTGLDMKKILNAAKSKNLDNDKLLEIVTYAASKNANNVVGYIISLINDGHSKSIKTSKKNGFNNFEGRNYSVQEMEELEKLLISNDTTESGEELLENFKKNK